MSQTATKEKPELSNYIDARFSEPKGWRWHHFTRQTKNMERKIRFGSVFPQDSIPDAIVVCLPGLSEFGEKYYEVAQNCLDMNFAFWVLDWVGQGGSTRYLKNPLKRHGVDFGEDVEDLHKFIMDYIKHSSVHPDKGRIPMVMLGHSMGANIGLQYLHGHPDIFECAAFTAPMFGIAGVNKIPQPLISPLSSILKFTVSNQFTSFHGNHSREQNTVFENNPLTNDAERFKIMDSFMNENEILKIGDVTFGWVYHALKACKRVNNPAFLKSLETPCMIAVAGKEQIVDNDATRVATAHIPHCQLVEYESARHEILMEKDEIRNAFFKSFHSLVKEHILDRPETLKPF